MQKVRIFLFCLLSFRSPLPLRLSLIPPPFLFLFLLFLFPFPFPLPLLFLEEEMKKYRESCCEDDNEDIDLIVNSDARGLERRILNAMELPIHRHKRSVEVALDTQRRLENVKHCDFFDADKRTRLIASQYGKSAEYAAAWARQTAQADARAVEL